jgi:hypothetical protein
MKLARTVAMFAAVMWLIAGCVMAHAARYTPHYTPSICAGIDDQKLKSDCLAHVAKMQAFYKQCESTRHTPAYRQCL